MIEARPLFLALFFFLGSSRGELMAYLQEKTEKIVTVSQAQNLFHHTLNTINLPPDSIFKVGNILKASGIHFEDEQTINRGELLIGIAHYYNNKLDSASAALAEVAFEFNRSFPQSLEEGLAHNFLGSVFTRLNSPKRALLKFQEAISIFRQIKDNNYLSLSLSNAGTIYGAQGDYAKALEFFLEAQHIAMGSDVSSDRKASVLSNISIVYSGMGKKREALSFAFKALAIDQQTNNKTGICQSYNAIAGIYNLTDNYDSALYYYNKSLSLAVPGDPRFMPIVRRSLQNIFNLYTRQKKFQEAIEIIQHIRKSVLVTEDYQVETFLNMIAQNKYSLQEYDSAIYYAHKALASAQQSNIKIAIRNAYGYLRQSYFAKKSFDSAYYYQALQHAYTDSIYNESNKSNFDNLRIELETLEKQREIDLLKKESELHKAQSQLFRAIVLLGAIIVGLVILSIILVNRNRAKRQRLEKLELQNELDQNKKDLHQQTLRIIQTNNLLTELQENLKRLKIESGGGKSDIQQILNTIHLSKSAEKEWENFDTYFGNVHKGFYKKLTAHHPNLTISEKRLVGLIRMNLTNREIANILNIENSSVKMAKYRLKKKLEIPEEQDLYSFIQAY